ncbi:uncharacterized protein LOC141710533 [Apium graveolens]|uniref:uncharacterized protein LOC141710533 n=1 Tax=Apium graveolens TaxID=4045 RepID=UPI003D798D9F
MFNVQGDNDLPSRWENKNTQFVNDPLQAGLSGVDCTFCHVLRDIIHLKGDETTKLEIHGRFGMICHGILEISTGDMAAPNKEYKRIDFCNTSIPDVREFLVDYFDARSDAYYCMVDDPLQTFYDALCVQSEWDCVLGDNFQASQGKIDTNQSEARSKIPKKRTYKEQIEYVKSLTIKDIAKFFHLREHDAARHLEISPSTIKKIARNAGLERWPYRKIKANEKSIRKILGRIDPANPTTNAKAEEELQMLLRKKDEFYAPYQ